MSYAERQEGLRLLRENTAEFTIGEWDHERGCVPLRDGSRIVGRVSEELLEDWPAVPANKRIVEQGIQMIREESRTSTPRVVSMTNTGCRFE
jgi:hypothetical protein